MINPAALPDIIPVFPLPGALLLPRSRLPLHIFEPRYLAMLEDVFKTRERLVGMIQPQQGKQRPGNGLHLIGCAGRVTQFSEAEDGRAFVTLSGISRFRIIEEIQGFTPYRRCRVSWETFTRDLGGEERDEGFDRAAFMALLHRYLSRRELQTDWETLQEAGDELLINSLSMLLAFEVGDKQALLEAPSLVTRRETLVTLIEYSLRGGDYEERLQ